MRKRLPNKAVNITQKPVGSFNIQGRCEKAKLIAYTSSVKEVEGEKGVLDLEVKREEALQVTLYRRWMPSCTLVIPAQVASALKIGTVYEIQCTIMEVKEDAQS